MNEKKTITSFLKANAMQLFTIIMLSLATYITFRLAPMAQDIALVKQKVDAMDVIVQDRISKSEIEIWLMKFDKQITSMQGQVEFLYQLHMK